MPRTQLVLCHFCRTSIPLNIFFIRFLCIGQNIFDRKSRIPQHSHHKALRSVKKYFSRKGSHTETSGEVHAECFQPAAFLLCCTTSPVLTYVQRLKNVTIIARFRAFVKPLSGREPVESGTSKPEGSRNQNANSGAMDPERAPVEAIQKAGRSRRISPPWLSVFT